MGINVEVGDLFGEYHHAYTHFKVTLFAYRIHAAGQEPKPLEASELRWVERAWLENFPMGKIDRMISRDLIAEV